MNTSNRTVLSRVWFAAFILYLVNPVSAQTFIDATSEAGVSSSTGFVGWTDANNDGWIDLWISGGNLWINNQDGTFSAGAGLGSNPLVFADVNNDGNVDYYLFSGNRIGLGDGTGQVFTSQALPAAESNPVFAGTLADWNGDAYLDLFIGSFPDLGQFGEQTGGVQFFLNNKDNTFTNQGRTFQWYARGATASDFDNDGDQDVYFSNYWNKNQIHPNHLLLNDPATLTLIDVASDRGVASSSGGRGGFSHGSVFADFNNDGNMDLLIANLSHDQTDQVKLMVNNGPPNYTFSDVRASAGITFEEGAAHAAVGDINNDGYEDIFIGFFSGGGYCCTGAQLYQSTGPLQYTRVTRTSGIVLGQEQHAAFGDYDRDGDVDVYTHGKLYKNNGTAGTKWVEIYLRGAPGKMNAMAVGAKVKVTAGNRMLFREIRAGDSSNQASPVCHFGLGNYDGSDVQIDISWPDGKSESKTVATNSITQFNSDGASFGGSGSEGGSGSGSSPFGGSSDGNASIRSFSGGGIGGGGNAPCWIGTFR